MRIGHGYDLHRLVEGRALFLGGVKIESSRGLLGHSDGDVVLHAICDAILGALGAGDIGQHFPDTDERFRGTASSELLKHIATLLLNEGMSVVNVDVTVCAEQPKLAPYRLAMRSRIAELLGIPAEAASIKAKTNEGIGPVGEGQAIWATAVVLLDDLSQKS